MSRILIIDDELPLRQLLRSTLERAGHTVFDAPDGLKGMALWRDEPVDVVVTDLFMPEKDGVEVIQGMKNVETKPKIIAMSGGGQRGLLDWDLAITSLGADRMLAKPFDQRTFLLAVEELINYKPNPRDTVFSPSVIEQRKYPRIAVTLPVVFSHGEFAYTGTVVDISHEGCRIRSADAAPGAKYFRVEIGLDGPRATLTVDLAVMRWSRNGEFGVEFIRMEPDHQARLRGLIRNCEEVCATEGRGEG